MSDLLGAKRCEVCGETVTDERGVLLVDVEGIDDDAFDALEESPAFCGMACAGRFATSSAIADEELHR